MIFFSFCVYFLSSVGYILLSIKNISFNFCKLLFKIILSRLRLLFQASLWVSRKPTIKDFALFSHLNSSLSKFFKILFLRPYNSFAIFLKLLKALLIILISLSFLFEFFLCLLKFHHCISKCISCDIMFNLSFKLFLHFNLLVRFVVRTISLQFFNKLKVHWVVINIKIYDLFVSRCSLC